MKYRRKIAGFGTLFIALCVGCQKPAVEAESIRPVQALKIGDAKAIQSREFPGRAKARDEVDLSFRVSGPLVSLPVDVGTRVKKGDLIASIDPKDFETALESAQGHLGRAKAQLSAMQKGARAEEIEQLKAAVASADATYRQSLAEYERYEGLLKKGVVSQGDYDIALARRDRNAAQLKAANEDLNIGKNGARQEDIDAKQAEIRSLEATVSNAKNQLDDSVLKAPFEANVAARYVDNFQTVQAKQTIVRLLDDSRIEVTIQVPESVISLVPSVKQAVCKFDAIAGREFVGKVTKIGSEASQSTRTYPVTIELEQPEDARIMPGMAAVVHAQALSGDAAGGQAIIVPASALLAGSGEQSAAVWVVADGKHVTKRPVKTGKLTNVGVTVIEGLKTGDWVVTAGVNSLRENQEVKLLTEGSK